MPIVGHCLRCLSHGQVYVGMCGRPPPDLHTLSSVCVVVVSLVWATIRFVLRAKHLRACHVCVMCVCSHARGNGSGASRHARRYTRKGDPNFGSPFVKCCKVVVYVKNSSPRVRTIYPTSHHIICWRIFASTICLITTCRFAAVIFSFLIVRSS